MIIKALPKRWRRENRRLLGEIEGVEEEAWVQLLSASPDDGRPVLAVHVTDGLDEGDAPGTTVAYVDPRQMAELLIEHGYAVQRREGTVTEWVDVPAQREEGSER